MLGRRRRRREGGAQSAHSRPYYPPRRVPSTASAAPRHPLSSNDTRPSERARYLSGACVPPSRFSVPRVWCRLHHDGAHSLHSGWPSARRTKPSTKLDAGRPPRPSSLRARCHLRLSRARSGSMHTRDARTNGLLAPAVSTDTRLTRAAQRPLVPCCRRELELQPRMVDASHAVPSVSGFFNFVIINEPVVSAFRARIAKPHGASAM